jgi:multidrug resistance efflux pump
MEPKSKRPLLISALALVVSAVILAVIYSYYPSSDTALSYTASTGVIEATEVNISPEIAGRLQFLCCKVGDKVTEGEVILRLDQKELLARLGQEEARLKASKEAINDARVGYESSRVQNTHAAYEVQAGEAEVKRLKALVAEAEANLERAIGLFKQGFVSRRDMDASQTSYETNIAMLGSSEARLRADRASLKTSGLNVESARIRLNSAEAGFKEAEAGLSIARAMLEKTEVMSPVTGVIVYKAFEQGEVSGAGLPVYTVHDLNGMWAAIDVQETLLPKVALGAKATVSLPGMPRKSFEARVAEIGEVAGFATQRDVERGASDIKTFRVKAALLRPDPALKPGMTVEVRVYTSE